MGQGFGGLHIEGHRNLAPYLRARGQEDPDPSGSSGDPGDVAGSDATDHGRRGHGRHGDRGNLFVHVRDDEWLGVCAPGDDLEHDPEKWEPVFPRDKTRSVLPEDHAQSRPRQCEASAVAGHVMPQEFRAS